MFKIERSTRGSDKGQGASPIISFQRTDNSSKETGQERDRRRYPVCREGERSDCVNSSGEGLDARG